VGCVLSSKGWRLRGGKGGKPKLRGSGVVLTVFLKPGNKETIVKGALDVLIRNLEGKKKGETPQVTKRKKDGRKKGSFWTGEEERFNHKVTAQVIRGLQNLRSRAILPEGGGGWRKWVGGALRSSLDKKNNLKSGRYWATPPSNR